MNFGSGRSAKVVAHDSGRVSVIVGCSTNPFPRDNLIALSFLLETVRDELQFKYLRGAARLPLFADWMIVQWHYNKDGGEVSGERFNITFFDFAGVLCRFYSKDTPAGKLRLERIESPRKSLRELSSGIFESDRTE